MTFVNNVHGRILVQNHYYEGAKVPKPKLFDELLEENKAFRLLAGIAGSLPTHPCGKVRPSPPGKMHELVPLGIYGRGNTGTFLMLLFCL